MKYNCKNRKLIRIRIKNDLRKYLGVMIGKPLSEFATENTLRLVYNILRTHTEKIQHKSWKKFDAKTSRYFPE
jgi:hypothetical protein